MGTRINVVCFLIAISSPAQAIIQATEPALTHPATAATLMFESPQGIVCSATSVGPRTILTSAYCAVGGVGQVVAGPRRYRVNCESHPQFMTNLFADFALCYSGDAPLPSAIAQLNDGEAPVRSGIWVSLFGVGCRDQLWGELLQNLPLQGQALVIESGAAAGWASIVTKGAASCFGDAGGGVFVAVGTPKPMLLGVQIRSDLDQISWVAPVHTPLFRDWALEWSEKNRAGICGVSDVDVACHPQANSEPNELPRATRAAQTLGVSNQPRRLLKGVVYTKGESLKQLSDRICESSNNHSHYRNLSRYLATRGDLFVDRTEKFAASGLIDLPACPNSGLPPIQHVTSAIGDTPRGYFARHSERWEKYASAQGATLSSRSFLDVYHTLNPTLRVGSPLRPGTLVSIPTGPLAPEEAPLVTASLQIKNNDPRVDVAMTDAELQAVSSTCVGNTAHTYPYDVEALVDVLASNRAHDGSERREVTIVVADNGLFLSKSGGFDKNILFRGPEENKEWDRFAASILPLQMGTKPSHGTQVSSLALGGPMLARLWSFDRGSPNTRRLKLKIARIYTEQLVRGMDRVTNKEVISRAYLIERNAFNTIIKMASKDSAIVNLSLKYYEEIPQIRDALASSSRILFVVAAGNEDGRLGDGGTKVYPAMYGGEIRDGSPNVITVGGVDGRGEFFSLSNYGPNWVDIAAPSCAVPVLSYNRDTKSWSTERLHHGTSLATPIVSFAAALIQSETGYDPSFTKRRILVSADLKPNLADKFADGRVLNIPHALSIWHDVLEVGSLTQALRGKVRFKKAGQPLFDDSVLEFKCRGSTIPVAVASILRLVPNFTNLEGKKVLKLYSRSGSDTEKFQSHECLPMGDVVISMSDLETSVESEYKLDEVRSC